MSAQNRRAWALRERLLSSRIVHFSKTEILWECHTCSTRESCSQEHFGSYGSGVGDFEGEDFKRVLQASQSADEDSGKVEASRMAWYRIVQSYSGRLLTRQSDKMTAIAGIATSVAALTGFTYRHGMWEEDFRSGLLWRVDPFAMKQDSDRPSVLSAANAIRTSTGPSWSWTSVSCKVLYDFGLTVDFDRQSTPTEPSLDAQLLEVQTRPIPHFLNASYVYGSTDMITLYALICPVLLHEGYQNTAQVFDMTEYNASSSPFAWATLEQIPSKGTAVHAVWITKSDINGGVRHDRVFFLLVVPSELGNATWRRIGIGQMEEHLGPFEALKQDDLKRVDLV